MMRSFGFRCKEGGKNFEAIQPRYVFRLNVEGKTEDELMAAFHQKWRYNIRLAERKGVTVKICGKEMVPAFADLMLTTGVRDGFVTRQPEYFANMLDNLGEHARLYMAFDPEGTPIAGTLAIHYGDKVWYLYGASSNEHRNLMPNYLLQWRMIQWAVETGCRIYDFRGVSGNVSEDNPLYGLFRFKQGFGVEMGNDLFRFRDCLRGVLRNLRQMIFKKHITVTVNGKKCRVLGHIGMLHTCVDVTNVPCAVGDPAVFDLKPLLLKGIEVVYR